MTNEIECFQDSTTGKLKIRAVLVRFGDSTAAAIKELTAYDKEGNERGHVEYAIEFGANLSVDYLLLKSQSFDKIMDSCEEVTMLRGDVLDKYEQGQEVLRSN
ncbi:unnamed protein product [Heligmosomoides polygyrus]|uniref:Uncharacterized protein n=1 Tax=Heligmosomoides polygyrus TaxID=6339 RepID=A0A3P8DD81_HELPZ|nr:unnamed protein product [Heligmosomoides polygyrus]